MTACPACSFDPDAVVSASWSFMIDREIATGNARVFNVGGSRWRYAKERDAWRWEFRAVRLLRKIHAAAIRRRVMLTRHFDGRQRAFDRDNLATGAKPVVDAMVREGLLRGDDEASAEIRYTQVRGGHGLSVLLEELAP